MSRFVRRFTPIALAAGFLIAPGVSPAFAAGQVTFSVDAPTVQGSFVDGVTLETFDDGCINPLAFGSFRGQCWGSAANSYSGASTTSSAPTTLGTGTPLATIPMGGAIRFDLDKPASYLGFHWEAGNEFDRVQLFSGDTEIADFSFETLMAALESTELDSADGQTTYTVADYFGNPVTGQQIHEPYAYVHIFASEGVTFDRVRISEDRESVGFFEFDNMAILFAEDSTITADTFDDVVELDSVTVTRSADELAPTGAMSPNGFVLVAFALLLLSLALRPRTNRK